MQDIAKAADSLAEIASDEAITTTLKSVEQALGRSLA